MNNAIVMLVCMCIRIDFMFDFTIVALDFMSLMSMMVEWKNESNFREDSICWHTHTHAHTYTWYKWIFKIDKIKANTNTFETY